MSLALPPAMYSIPPFLASRSSALSGVLVLPEKGALRCARNNPEVGRDGPNGPLPAGSTVRPWSRSVAPSANGSFSEGYQVVGPFAESDLLCVLELVLPVDFGIDCPDFVDSGLRVARKAR